MSARLEAAIRELVGAMTEELRAESSPAAPPRLLSVAEAARACGLSRAAFYRSVLGQGAIPVHRIGRRVLISQAALASWIDGGAPIE
jgi:excisionase family DNA binding protein